MRTAACNFYVFFWPLISCNDRIEMQRTNRRQNWPVVIALCPGCIFEPRHLVVNWPVLPFMFKCRSKDVYIWKGSRGHCSDMTIFNFKITAVRHLGFLVIQIFNCRYGSQVHSTILRANRRANRSSRCWPFFDFPRWRPFPILNF